ncbi:MAG: hypothetical protein IPN23_10430 [Elusimicrobia bacterium]|nr:hypothetical protein [Elusimicrobiota bacterium]
MILSEEARRKPALSSDGNIRLRDSTCKDFEKYTGVKISSERSRGSRTNQKSPVLVYLEEIHGVVQNMNLGWFWIEQAEELETDEGRSTSYAADCAGTLNEERDLTAKHERE